LEVTTLKGRAYTKKQICGLHGYWSYQTAGHTQKKQICGLHGYWSYQTAAHTQKMHTSRFIAEQLVC